LRLHDQVDHHGSRCGGSRRFCAALVAGMSGLENLIIGGLLFAIATLVVALLVAAAFVAIERWLERRRR